MIPFHDFISKFIQYEKAKNFSDNTLIAYESDLYQFQEYLIARFEGYQIILKEIDKYMIQDYMIELSNQHISNRSLERKITSIREFFKYLYMEDYIQINPAKTIHSPKYSKKLPISLTSEELSKLCEIPNQTTPFGSRNIAIIKLFYSSGLRASELCNLLLNDIQLTQKKVVVTGKGNKQRVIPVSDDAILAIDQYLSVRNHFKPQSNHMFVSKSGIALTYTEIYKILKMYFRQTSKESSCSTHTLRHTFATHLMENGADIRAIQEMLGHESISTTEIYTHVAVSNLKKVYKKLHPRSKPDKTDKPKNQNDK